MVESAVGLKIYPNASICILHLDYGQIIVEGQATLKTWLTDPETTVFYWNHYLDQYWRDFYLSRATFTAPGNTVW